MSRGVILVHVLILVALMGFMAALTLKWTLSHHLAAKLSVESNENRSLLHAAQVKVFTCLSQDPNFPNASCVPAGMPACLAGGTGMRIGSRTFNYSVSKPPSPAVPPPCVVNITLCGPGETSC